jgi:putative flippase GtrA
MIRWWKFNAVGLAGVAVQLAALWILVHLFRMPYLAATALSVEVALLHNFAWHEHWTWPGLSIENRWRRLLRFHLGNGFLSIASNVVFTWIFKQHFGMPLLAANVTAIAVTSLVNYLVAARWVFRRSEL